MLVLGAGSWGTALALVLARRGRRVFLWDVDDAHVRRLIADRRNARHLPDFPFPETLSPIAELQQVPGDAGDLVVAVPCEGLRDALGLLAREAGRPWRTCVASKGLEPGAATLNHEIVRECLGEVAVAVLSGPSFAREVAAGNPTAVTIASEAADTAGFFADCFHGGNFRVYTHDDVIGVQVGGAVKNVMAIAAGIADGLGFGSNTRAALITRGLAEITRLGLAMGARRETFTGLAGLGDLVLTCTDDQSRNRRMGLALARGSSMADARAAIGQAVEGVRTAEAVCSLAEKYGVDMPISLNVRAVVRGEVSPRDAVQALLARERKSEDGQ
jgi:glycerol-3-phosphate dehydrogenase (NAD(P)+)